MDPHTTIEIDLALHKAIETERQSFEESANDILHRMITKRSVSVFSSGEHVDLPKGSKAWFGSGVELPHGTRLRMSYNGCQHTAEIIEGRWFVDGDYYNSPSAAAYAVARTSAGEAAHINGWIYWEAMLPGNEGWLRLIDMRVQHR